MAALDTAPAATNTGKANGKLAALMRDPRLPLSIVLTIVLLVLVAPAIYILVQGSFAITGVDGKVAGWTLDHFAKLLSNSRLFTSFFNSVIFAAGSAVVSLLVGGVIAWLVERTNSPFKMLAYITAIVSMGTPYVLYVVSWLYLLGSIGPLNGIYKFLTGSSENLFQVHSMGGMILIEGFLWSPLVFLMLSSTFRAANADMEEAARMSGATVLGTIRRVTIPLAMPSIVALALFVFIRAVEAFEVPMLVGMPSGIHVLITDVYESTQLVPPDLGYSSAFAVVLLVFVAILFTYYGRLTRNADRYQSITGKGYRPREFDLGGWRWAAGAFIVFEFVVILVLPILTLIWISLLPFMSGISMQMLSRLTLKNYVAVFNQSHYLSYSFNTITIAAVAATAAIAITAIGGWIAARRGPGAWLVDQLATLPLIFPGIVMGVALMQIYLRLPFPIYGTLWAIIIAYIIRYMPYGMRYSYSGVLQIHRELEEAASVAGAGVFGMLRRIIAPLLSPALISGWIFIFLICAKELAVAVLLAGPNSQVIAVAMLDLWVNGQGGELAAFGLVWTVVMVTIALIFFVLSRAKGTEAFA